MKGAAKVCGRWLLALALAGGSWAFAAETAAGPAPMEQRVDFEDPAWRDLLEKFAARPPTGVSDFVERRWFTFKKTPTVLKGEARVSVERGLSLHYPDEARTVIVDRQGMLVREKGRDTIPPRDPRAAAVNMALLHLLSFQLKPLTEGFEIAGEREGHTWRLALWPRADALRRTLGQITVAGEEAVVRRIELRRSTTQRVEIAIEPPRSQGEPFTTEELQRFFR